MAPPDDWGGVPVQAAPKGDDWGGVPVNQAPPKLPDTSGFQQTVIQNLNKPTEGAGEQKPQSPAQKLDAGLGMPAFGGDKNTPLPAEIRGHIADAQANGTATNASDYMQTALPAAAYHTTAAGAFGRGAEQSALPTLTGFAAFAPGAAAGAELAAPAALASGPFAPLVEGGAALVGGLLTSMGASYATAAGQKAFLEAHPQIASALGLDNQKLIADVQQHPTASFAGQLAPNLALMRPGATSLKQVALGGTLMGGQETGRELASDEKLDPEKIVLSTIMGAISNKETRAGSAISSKMMAGYEALKPVIGEKIGKDPKDVTHQDIDQAVAKEYEDRSPKEQDYHDIATIMDANRKPLPAASPVNEDQPLYADVPKRPQSLSEFLAEKGGVKDEGGELTAMDVDKAHKGKPFAKRLVKEDGMSLDDAARAAEQAGFFPEKGGERPTTSELISKLRDDLSGNHQHSEHDLEAVAAYHEALNRNAEIDQMSTETGIDTKGKTHAQFWDEVKNKLSPQDANAKIDYSSNRAEEGSESWRTEALEPEEKEARELENARKQKQAIEIKFVGTTGSGEPGSISGSEKPGQEVSGLIGGGVESARGTNESGATTGQSSTAATLRLIWRETGKPPDAVFEDSKIDPSIDRDIVAGKVPEAYAHLRKQPLGEGEELKSSEPSSNSKEYAQSLYDRLHEKLGHDQATDIHSMQRELVVKSEIGKELDEKFYLKKEGNDVKLTDEEQKLYEKYMLPLAQEERALYELARELGAKDVEPVSEDYVHRIVKGKGHYLDKYDPEFGSDENIGFGRPQRNLSQKASGLEQAQFHALEDAEGNRVFKVGEIPEGYKAGDKWTDKNGKEWTIKRAKTEEIEKNTDVQYYKSGIGNTEENIRKLDKTIRNIEFLNGLKEDMQKTGLGVSPSEETHPKDYQSVNIPQLRGWSFDPRISEVMNDIYDRGGDGLMSRLNNFLIKGMFLNPIPHVENVAYDYVASRGWQNANLIGGARYMSEGIRDVKEFSPLYLEVLKKGGALRLPAIWKTEFFNQMERQFIGEMQDSKEGLELAKSWGFESAPKFAETIYNNSQKALWGSGDAFLMAKIRELKDQGMSTEEAIHEAQRHMVDYRIPPRVGENILGPELSRLVSKALQGNAFVVFTRYHFGLFKSLGNMVKDLVGGAVEGDVARSKDAAGQMFATYLLLTVVNPAIANVMSSITGDEEKMRNPGITGLVGAIKDLANGDKSVGQALSSQFIASPGVKVGADLLNNNIIDTAKGHEAVQLMDYLMKQPTMSVPAIPYNIREGNQSVGEEALRQVGVTPNKEYKKKKPSRRSIRKLESEEESLLGD